MSTLLAAIPGVFGGGTATLGGKLAMAGTAAATGIGALAQIQAGANARRAGEAANEIAQQRARQAREEGSERAHRMTIENRRRLGAMKARMAGRGVAPGAGSSLDFLSEAARRLTLQTEDAWRAASIDAQNEEYRGRLSLWEGQQAGSASRLRGFGTLLEGGSRFYNQGVQLGAFNPYSKRIPRAIPVGY